MLRDWLPVLAAAVLATGGRAAVSHETVSYRDGDLELRGYLAYDDAATGRRPGVIVVHEWYGLNDYAKQRTDELAAQGYVALAADYYGGGKCVTTADEAKTLAGQVRGTPAMRTRGQAALDLLRQNPRVDPERIAILGFCFGGTAALELSYTGAPVRASISIHGGLPPAGADDVARMKAHYLILHGAEDKSVSPEQMTAFLNGLRQAKVDWELDEYGGAVHGFSNPAAGNDPTRGVAYNEPAARRAWQRVGEYLREVLAG